MNFQLRKINFKVTRWKFCSFSGKFLFMLLSFSLIMSCSNAEEKQANQHRHHHQHRRAHRNHHHHLHQPPEQQNSVNSKVPHNIENSNNNNNNIPEMVDNNVATIHPTLSVPPKVFKLGKQIRTADNESENFLSENVKIPSKSLQHAEKKPSIKLKHLESNRRRKLTNKRVSFPNENISRSERTNSSNNSVNSYQHRYRNDNINYKNYNDNKTITNNNNNNNHNHPHLRHHKSQSLPKQNSLSSSLYHNRNVHQQQQDIQEEIHNNKKLRSSFTATNSNSTFHKDFRNSDLSTAINDDNNKNEHHNNSDDNNGSFKKNVPKINRNHARSHPLSNVTKFIGDDDLQKQQKRTIGGDRQYQQRSRISGRERVFRRKDQLLIREQEEGIVIYSKFETSIPCPPASHVLTVRPRYNECRCNALGSFGINCDQYSGQCLCQMNVTGRRCDQCQPGSWNMTAGVGCEDCDCSPIGSFGMDCNPWTGQCECKIGVGGRRCDRCLEGHYGLSNIGCKRCELCPSEWHVCDSETGRCVCPSNSKGPNCGQCVPGTWGWKQIYGCETCSCDIIGSIGMSCDSANGQCVCREGYTGRRCDSCASGYFGYPDCKRCNCNPEGTLTREDGRIQCDSHGQCPCKEFVTGAKCDICIEGTFGLSQNNPRGCTECFCFGRSQKCTQSDLSWGHIRMSGARNVSIQYINTGVIPQRKYEYIVVIQMEGRNYYHNDAEISVMNGLSLIPSYTGNVSIGSYNEFYHPLYFQLPPQFHGDKTMSYGGYLRFQILGNDCTTFLEKTILENFPVVQIHAQNRLVLDYYEPFEKELINNGSYIIPLVETYWKYHHDGRDINRAVLMTALQNIKHIFLRGTIWSDFTEVILHDVYMDSAIYLSGAVNNIAKGIEKCDCARKFDGLSCQDPGPGYYRQRNFTDSESVYIDDLIGHVIPCECNGRSTDCDRETGECVNCSYNTGGRQCERCGDGFYGDPNIGEGCKSCPCPETNRNYARGCSMWQEDVNCLCKRGYAGPLCDRCAPGYYGVLTRHSGECRQCECDLNGIERDGCDIETGQCYCKYGVTGRQCNICEAEHYFLENGYCKLCDNCTLLLISTVDLISRELKKQAGHIDFSGIPLPWIRLQEYVGESERLRSKLRKYTEMKNELIQFDGTEVEKFLSYSQYNNIQWNRINAAIVNNSNSANILRLSAEKEIYNMRLLHGGLFSAIDSLKSWIRQNHHISIPLALEKVTYYLNEIKRYAAEIERMKNTGNSAFDMFYFFGNFSDFVQDQRVEIEKFWRLFNNTNSRLTDLSMMTFKTQEILSEADDSLMHIKVIKDILVEDYENIRETNDEISKQLNNSLITQTGTYLDMIEDETKRIGYNARNVEKLNQILEQTLDENGDYRNGVREHWVPKAFRHANHLMSQAKKDARQFQNAYDGARIVLLASTAHKNISDAVEAAYAASLDAQKTIADLELERILQDVSSRSRASLSNSKLQQREAVKEMERIDKLQSELRQQQSKVDLIKSIMWQAGVKNNDISASLELIRKESSMNKLDDILDVVTKISEQMRTETRNIIDTKLNIYKLKQKFISLEPEWDMKKGLIEENISDTLTKLRNAEDSLTDHERYAKTANDKFKLWNSTLFRGTQELKDKIARARHAAQGIKISLESKKLKCIRLYTSASTGVSTSNHIRLSLALNNKNTNSYLLYIQGAGDTYIALEMFKRKIRFLWNLGGTTGIVEHPLQIEAKDLSLDDAWYHIEANRTLNVGSLTVRRMTNIGVLETSTTTTGTSNPDNTRFFRNHFNRIWLGGAPENQPNQLLNMISGLNVVIHQAYVDNLPIGLWNFMHSEGDCDGAIVGAQPTSETSNARYFNGAGYAQVRKIRPRPHRKNVFSLQMTFKTFDENALLFLAVDDRNNRSVSVTLNGGFIVFRIDYGDELKLEINTTQKYNNGKWVRIEAAREFVPKRGTEKGSLKVDNTEPLTGSPTKPITSQSLPDLSKTLYYLGGVPPGFRSGISKAPGADYPFLGCMMDVQINGETYDPIESFSYFGVEQSCKTFITKAGFYGKGYIELSSHSLRKVANVGFVFRTLQSDALLLLSVYSPQIRDDYDARDLKGNYSIIIVDGQIQASFSTGKSAVKLISNKTVNDGEYHVINVIKTKRRIELFIDDESQDVKYLSGPLLAINMPKDAGGMYLGGAPDFMEYKTLIPASPGLIGAIRDVVFNNRTISLSEMISFQNVQIGRLGPFMGRNNFTADMLINTEPIAKSFAPNHEGCHRVGSYSYEPNAFKFGDGPNSHSELNIPIRRFWQRNFLIKFDFRTFYPNGLLLIAPGTKEKQKHFVGLLLKDGNLVFIVRGRKKEELTLTVKLNDGEWHHVEIQCQERKVTMSVVIGNTGKRASAQMRIPKRISASNLVLIGGLSDSNMGLPSDLFMKLESFKGCIRKFTINNRTQDLARPSKHLNVGQCFPKVEKGSYFPGDAYAIYKKSFRVGKYLELELEFKTSELNGVLLSVSEPVGFPALSLELHNGKVVFSCDFGDGNPFRVESFLSSKYSVCDNKWHNISALYNFEQIALRIDNNSAIIALAQPGVAGNVYTKSALYIGGLPDVAPSGSLLNRENFKGCIRNISIRNERKDWTDMDSLHNILLSDCLAIN